MTVTTAEKLAELQREMNMRLNVYPRFVAEGRITQREAARQIKVLQAIIDDYASADRFDLESG